MTIHTAPQKRDFTAKTLRALSNRGIAIVGVTMLPDDSGLSFANGDTGYVLNNNGTQQIKRHGEVVALALLPKSDVEYCVVYRTGDIDTFLWSRSEPMTKDQAQSSTLGNRRYVVKYADSVSIGLPETYE